MEGYPEFPSQVVDQARALASKLYQPQYEALRAECPDVVRAWCEADQKLKDEELERVNRGRAEESQLTKTIHKQNPGISESDLRHAVNKAWCAKQVGKEREPDYRQEPAIPLVPERPLSREHTLLIVSGLHDRLLPLPKLGPWPSLEWPAQSKDETLAQIVAWLKTPESRYAAFIRDQLPRITAENLNDLGLRLEQLRLNLNNAGDPRIAVGESPVVGPKRGLQKKYVELAIREGITDANSLTSRCGGSAENARQAMSTYRDYITQERAKS